MARKHLPITVAIVVGIAAALSVWTHAAQGPRMQCTVSGKGDVDAGWVEKSGSGESFRCVPTFDSSFKPSGAAWVRVNGDGSIGARLPQ